MSFYSQLRQLCFDHNVSESKLAEDLGFTRTALAKWRTGIIPRMNTIKVFADYFDVPTEYFFEDTKKEPSQKRDDSVMTTAEFAVKFSRLSQNDQEKVMEYMTLLLSKN